MCFKAKFRQTESDLEQTLEAMTYPPLRRAPNLANPESRSSCIHCRMCVKRTGFDTVGNRDVQNDLRNLEAGLA